MERSIDLPSKERFIASEKRRLSVNSLLDRKLFFPSSAESAISFRSRVELKVAANLCALAA